jgi:hypothetical protein
MPSPEATPTSHDTTSVEDAPGHPPRIRPYSNLARGIVWADIVAEIAADERLRELREAA